jgi:Holliday junction DNA helicase RuvB
MAIKSSKKIETNRIVEAKEKKIDSFDNSLRPKKLNEYIGQNNIKKHLSVSIESAKIRKDSLEHILFY